MSIQITTTRSVSAADRDPVSLIGHRESVPADASLEMIQRTFSSNNHDFMAVVESDGKVLGLCSRRETAILLSARFGFALNARDPVRNHLRPNSLLMRRDTAITALIQTAVARGDESFFEDVILIEPNGELVGMIPMLALVRLQDELLGEKFEALRKTEAVIRRKSEALEEDLRTARDLQIAMLPSRDLADCNLAADYRYLPAGGVSGDSIDYVRLASGNGGVFVCDVMGHGVRSALITAMVRSLLQDFAPHEWDPGALFTRLNRQLTALLRQSPAFVFVTAILIVYDRAGKRLQFAQAGHPNPIVWQRESRQAAMIAVEGELEGPAFGLEDEYIYTAGSVPIAVGDRVFLYTDGLTEAGPDQDQFGLRRLIAELEKADDLATSEVLTRVLAAATQHAGEAFSDDICFAGIEVIEPE